MAQVVAHPWEKDLDRHFSKDMQMGTKHMIRCPDFISLYGNANQNHTEITLHQPRQVSENMENLKPSCHWLIYKIVQAL
jgi:hypothetical protein